MLKKVNGPQGRSGDDAKICQTYNAHTNVKARRELLFTMKFTIEKESHSINKNCPVEYVSNNEVRMPKQKSKKLFYAQSITLYRTFLTEKMRFKPLSTTATESYQAINSNSNI